MRDRLTKKRVKVDCAAIIEMLDLIGEYHFYLIEKKPRISQNRRMLAFLRSKHVDIYWCNVALKNNVRTFAQLLEYCGSYKATMEYAYGM